ncbi:hypothetical protein AB0P36_32585 [Streptomyces flavidovirens]|uniref:hypothetical protein n=1 Tax=Streptomyces flavidovirens TaxID=67298 RepID=UPI00341DB4B9
MIELSGSLVSGAIIAVLASWLTSRSRNRQDQQAEIGAPDLRRHGPPERARGVRPAAELLSRERRVTKQTAAAVREPLARVAAAAGPLMRSSDPAVVTATEQLLQATTEVENTARLEEALAAFGRAVQHPAGRSNSGHRWSSAVSSASPRVHSWR